MAAAIKWTLVEVKASELKPNPKNPKKRNSKGFNRLQKSLEKFGRVFDGIINSDMTLIDGHSRYELAKPDQILRVFKPSRKLTVKEYSEMNAIYDMAKAGDIDEQILEENFTEDFFSEWDMTKEIKAIPKAHEVDTSKMFLINVELENEKQLESLYEELNSRGFKLKIIQ